MPIAAPIIDSRRYQDLVNEALARVPVHNPEWTNFNRSDPGVTLIELWAFLTENLLYRTNLIPERNRLKFLSLLGIPLKPASSAKGLVTFSNERGPLQTITLNSGLEVRAGQVPFKTLAGLDVLPVEARAYFKRAITPTQDDLDYYSQLYASFGTPAAASTVPTSGPGGIAQPTASTTTVGPNLRLYQAIALDSRSPTGVDLVQDTVDGSLWVALFARPDHKDRLDEVRAAIGSKTVSLGIVPVIQDPALLLPPAGTKRAEGQTRLEFLVPRIAEEGVTLPVDPRSPPYRNLVSSSTTDVLLDPGVVQLTLPVEKELGTWAVEPLEDGVGDFPPALEDTTLAARVVAWIRVKAIGAQRARILWAGINATAVTQLVHVSNEVLPNGTGEPDQVVRLSKIPVIPRSVMLTVSVRDASPPGVIRSEQWQMIDDLLSAGPEVPVPDVRLSPGAPTPPPGPINVFALDPESGLIRFGDGFHGRRPPAGSILRASYDYGLGRAGNVGIRSINSGPALPAGLKVSNPIRTWGGADAETVGEGERQVARYLQHRDRPVNAEDFETIARRTPGVDIGRVDVLAAFNPELAPSSSGDAPGAVTVMLLPKYDPAQPDAPVPDRFFLDSVCSHLDPRRLVTTEVFVRGPTYVPIWVSVGIDVVPGESLAEVRDRVKSELQQFLSPLPQAVQSLRPGTELAVYVHADTGWPLKKPVVRLELMAMVSKVRGVRLVTSLLLAKGNNAAREEVDLFGLELPRVAGILVVPGDAASLDQLRGTGGPAPGAPIDILPVPFVPEVC